MAQPVLIRRFVTWWRTHAPGKAYHEVTTGWPRTWYRWIMGVVRGITAFDRSVVALLLSLTSLLGVGALVAQQAASEHAVTVHVTVPACVVKGTK